ncbi:MAG TPA: hypothetical protein VL329_00485 [Nitrospiraceae bacterium]|nr:hypothetical protein [Nitrospiraceae bacterium]
MAPRTAGMFVSITEVCNFLIGAADRYGKKAPPHGADEWGAGRIT